MPRKSWATTANGVSEFVMPWNRLHPGDDQGRPLWTLYAVGTVDTAWHAEECSSS